MRSWRSRTQDSGLKTQVSEWVSGGVGEWVNRPISRLAHKSIGIFLCLTALTASVAGDAGAPVANTIVYDYSAKEATFDRKGGVTVLKGDAKIRRSSGDYLNSDEITMYKDIETGELIRIEAVGNVDMKEKDMKATSERAVFYETEERIELEGSEDSPAVVDDGKNRMEARTIIYFRKEDRLEASGGNVSGHVTIEGKEGEEGETRVQGDKGTGAQGEKGTEGQEER